MEGFSGPRRVDRRPAGQPIRIGERTLQPVAHVTGWHTAADGISDDWEGSGPVEVLVTDQHGQIYRVPISVAKNDTLRWLALAGVLVLPLNWLLRRTLLKRHVN